MFCTQTSTRDREIERKQCGRYGCVLQEPQEGVSVSMDSTRSVEGTPIHVDECKIATCDANSS